MKLKIARLIIYTAVALSICNTGLTYSAAPFNFRELHSQYVNSSSDEMLRESLSGKSDIYYYFSYYLHGMLSAVEATGDEALLKNVIHHIDNMLSKTVRSHRLRVWAPLEPNGWPVQMYSYKACVAIARAAAVIMQNPSFRAKYSGDAARYITFVDESIIQFWHLNVYRTTISWLPEDLGGWGNYTSWNSNASFLGQIAVFLYSATRHAPTRRTPMYLDIATRVGQGFKRKLQPSGTGWIWDNGTAHPESGANTVLVPDTSHANDEVRLIVFAHEAGLVFTVSDVQRMANTLSDTIWNGSLDNPMFSNYINGSNQRYRNRTEWNNGSVYDGWALLGRYSLRAHTALTYLLRAVVEGKPNPSVDVNGTTHGKVALSGHVLRNTTLRARQ